jgi:uncharacterized protein (TIGR02145 family)
MPFGAVLLVADLEVQRPNYRQLVAGTRASVEAPVEEAPGDGRPTGVRGKPEGPAGEVDRQAQIAQNLVQASIGRRARVGITAVREANDPAFGGLASDLLTLFNRQTDGQVIDWNQLYSHLRPGRVLLPQKSFGRHDADGNFLLFKSPSAESKFLEVLLPPELVPESPPWIDMGAYLQYGDTLILDKRDSACYRIGTLGGLVWMFENLRFPAEDSYCYERSVDLCARWGRYYTWKAAQKACPAGWRLPTGVDYGTFNSMPYETLDGLHFLQHAGRGYWNLEEYEYSPTGDSDRFYFYGTEGSAGTITFNSEKKVLGFVHKNAEGEQTTIDGDHFYQTHCYSVRCIKDP